MEMTLPAGLWENNNSHAMSCNLESETTKPWAQRKMFGQKVFLKDQIAREV